MDTSRICKHCRKPVPEGAPEGLCPECMANVALGTQPVPSGGGVPPEPADLAKQFPQLEIIELLGRGGMGIVYKARQPKLDRLVALKILPIESDFDASFAERFEREARALARLNHPGIVAVYDFGQTTDYYYFIMEHVDGMNLRQLLEKERISSHQALDLVMQICTALQFAHDAKIVHRDIKPANILINKQGQAKIADFGLAKLLGAAPDATLTATQTVMGTMNYMAPEQREKPLEVDHRADIYSLGVVLYEMLTGEVPMGHFQPPSKKVLVDVRLDEVVLHALEREPERRYQKASDVRTGVETIAATMKPSGGRTGPEKSWQSFKRAVVGRSKVIVTIAGVVGIVVAGLLWKEWANAKQLVKEGHAAETTGDLEGEYKVGYKFEHGLGVKQDYAEAIKWYRKAAEAGYAQGEFNLGYMYEYGRGIAKDYNEAVKWYAKAAEAGSANGQNSLGWLYEYGLGVRQDYGEAIRLYRKAADAGNDQARDNLARIEKLHAAQTSISKLGPRWTNSLGMVFVPVAGTSVSFSIWDTRVQDFLVFANETHYNNSWIWTWRNIGTNKGGHWCDGGWSGPETARGPSYPICGMCWNDAHAFCLWLTEKEHNSGVLKQDLCYRLPKEEEWSVIFGSSKYPWGDQWPPPSNAGNYAGWTTIPGNSDSYTRTSPVGSFPPNAFGLYDVGGNLWQWSEDLHGTNHTEGVLRGGSWADNSSFDLQSSHRYETKTGDHWEVFGFRCVISGIDSNALAVATASKQNAIKNNLRLINAAKKQWALEHYKLNSDMPGSSDLQPYLGRGSAGELPASVDGEVLIFGKVGESAVAQFPDGRRIDLQETPAGSQHDHGSASRD